MKIGKRIIKILMTILMIIFIFTTVSYVNHRIQLKKEDKLFKPLGDIVEVNGNKMSIYTEGNGKDTLVFMSGGGTCSPILDFKSLYSRLSDDYTIVVIEKLGYGFSDVVDKDRDIDSILSDSREALKRKGIEGPYILCPHSMSGLESIYWAKQYPEEVKAIVGLDMAVPDAYLDYKINMPLINLGSFAANMGITRFIPGACESDAIKYGTLTEEEKDIYRAVFFRRTATKTMLNEVSVVKNNALKVKEGSDLDIPILMFSSNGKGTGFNEESWKKYQHEYVADKNNAEVIDLECSHYIQDHEYERIEKDIKTFLKNITKEVL